MGKENRKCLEKRWDAILNTMAREHNTDVAFEQSPKARSQPDNWGKGSRQEIA